MLVNDLEQMIDRREEGRLVCETNDLGRPRKLLRYRPPGAGELNHLLSVSMRDVKPSAADLRLVEHALRRATAVHHLNISGPYRVQQKAVYHVYRLVWREEADQPKLL